MREEGDGMGETRMIEEDSRTTAVLGEDDEEVVEVLVNRDEGEDDV